MHDILTKTGAPLTTPQCGIERKSTAPTQRGRLAEDEALAYLLGQGLALLVRNYKTPGRGGGEIDLILRDGEGTLVFVEVRQRQSRAFGGAAASVSATKQRRLVFAAHHYLMRYRQLPACRFDVLTLEPQIHWIQAAFDASSFYRG